jgi:hypothetical protein
VLVAWLADTADAFSRVFPPYLQSFGAANVGLDE